MPVSQRVLASRLPFQVSPPDCSQLTPFSEPDSSVPLKSNGRRHVDLAADAALDQVGGRGLEHLERGDRAGGEILDLNEAAFRGEDLAAVVGGGDVGQAAHGDSRRLAAAAGHGDAGHAGQRGRGEGVGQLADILGDDRIEYRIGVALDRGSGFEAATQASDDDRLIGFSLSRRDRRLHRHLIVGIGRAGRACPVACRRNLRILGPRRPAADQQRESGNRGAETHLAH
jgi:hypothetical protein